MNNLFIGILLTLVPLIELRGGLPFALIYAKDNGISTINILILILILNILLIFIIFLFLDFLHKRLLKINWYERLFKKYLEKTQKKIDKFEKNYTSLGFIALMLFVAVPLPLTGAYSGSIISWILELDRKKSIVAISLGIAIAGLIIYFTTLGALGLF